MTSGEHRAWGKKKQNKGESCACTDNLASHVVSIKFSYKVRMGGVGKKVTGIHEGSCSAINKVSGDGTYLVCSALEDVACGVCLPSMI